MYSKAKSQGRRSLLRDTRGATAVEFALVAPVLFFCLLSIFELGVLGLMSNSLDNAVNAVSRTIRTGQSTAPTSAFTLEDKICGYMGGSITDCRARLTVSVDKFARFTDANTYASAPPNGAFDKGGPGDIVIVKANYNWPLMSPLVAQAYQHTGPMEIVIGARAAFKNEPFL